MEKKKCFSPGNNVRLLGRILSVIAASAFFFQALPYTVSSKDSVAGGLVFTMSNNAKMKVQVCSEKIIRVAYTLDAAVPEAGKNLIVVKADWPAVAWTVADKADVYSITTSKLRVDVAKATGAVSFFTAAGTAIVNEVANAKQLSAKQVGGQNCYGGTLEFNGTSDEGLYGFGQFQDGVFNNRGQSHKLIQANQTDCSPVFLSTRGFGILWIDYSALTFDPPIKLTSNWATNNAIDYYFMYGPQFDTIISGYRQITGPAPLWPKWAYGFWQCRNFYVGQVELINVVQKYREKGYPIDNIVQDWNYYPSGGNGCQCFDATRYPDMAATIKRLHTELNCHLTISVWPSFNSKCGKNYDFMNSRGYLLNVNDYLGQTYDAFNDSATYYYWKFINDSLVSKDVDGFWPDATEPEAIGWRGCNTSVGPAAKVENIFPLMHSKTLYDGYRKANNDKKRVCNLTRSYYAGSQRLSAAYWTGDVGVDFPTFAVQVPAGLNFCMTGMPLFCTDIGGFIGDNLVETEIRWFQWGAFNPVFRVHGTRACNEIWCWNDQLSQSEAILANFSNLRYRLFPYVYSLAWKVTSEGYTMMRGLPFDFPDDPAVRDLGNEFMFGPALLVCPVTEQGAKSRKVYLPAGKWYDFWSGASVDGGQTITASAPIDSMPLYTRAGSIIPMGPEVKYADSAADPIELRVYTGANGNITLYEDDNDGYAYEKGEYITIPISWDEASQNLTIGRRIGSFSKMLASRTFNVVWVGSGHGNGEQVAKSIDKAIVYNGTGLTLNKTTGQIGIAYSRQLPAGVSYATYLSGRTLFMKTSGKGVWTVHLFNAMGKAIAEKQVTGGGVRALFNRPVSGVYMAHVTYENGKMFKEKIVIP